jgi:hypothetical protein
MLHLNPTSVISLFCPKSDLNIGSRIYYTVNITSQSIIHLNHKAALFIRYSVTYRVEVHCRLLSNTTNFKLGQVF